MSARAAHFGSVAELLAFIASVLSETASHENTTEAKSSGEGSGRARTKRGERYGWLSRLRTRIVHPLRLTETFLFPDEATPAQTKRQASGYAQALAAATVSSHVVTAIDVTGRCLGSGNYPK